MLLSTNRCATLNQFSMDRDSNENVCDLSVGGWLPYGGDHTSQIVLKVTEKKKLPNSTADWRTWSQKVSLHKTWEKWVTSSETFRKTSQLAEFPNSWGIEFEYNLNFPSERDLISVFEERRYLHGEALILPLNQIIEVSNQIRCVGNCSRTRRLTLWT